MNAIFLRFENGLSDPVFPCIVLEDSMWSRPLAVRLAASLDGTCRTGVSRLWKTEEGIWTERAVYQANMLSKSLCGKYPLVITVKSLQKVLPSENDKIKSALFSIDSEQETSSFCFPKDRREDMWNAKIIFVCGHGIGCRENAERILKIAAACGAKVGATRPVVTDGWLPPEYLIGISGAEITPEICIVLGASGSQAFLAGIAESRRIISVNQDKNAPIFRKSDIGIVGDCMEFMDKWESVIGGEVCERSKQ